MSAIGKGDWVECVDASPSVVTGESILVAGAIYRVSAIVGPDAYGAMGLQLVGVALTANQRLWGLGWLIDRFRPIYRPSADFIEKLKQPVSTDELVTADGISHSNKPSRLLSSASGEQKQ